MKAAVGSAQRAHESQVAHSSSESLRAEYAALAAFLGTANTFRFTVLGLFLAAAGLMLSDPTDVKAALLLAVSLALWLAELRTRSLLSHVLRRGSKIEPRCSTSPATYVGSGCSTSRADRAVLPASWHVVARRRDPEAGLSAPGSRQLFSALT